MSKRMIAVMLLLAIFASPALGLAASPWTEATGYSDQVVGKFKFGFKNFFLGWTEIFSEPAEAKKEEKCVLTGVGVGILNAVLDTVGGAGHLLTFPVPQIDVPLPENGVSI